MMFLLQVKIKPQWDISALPLERLKGWGVLDIGENVEQAECLCISNENRSFNDFENRSAISCEVMQTLLIQLNNFFPWN